MDNEQLLKHFGVRPTAVRLLVFKGIIDYASPFSLEELYNFLSTIDRSSVFRALALFEEHHILHSFEDGSGKRKYCLCIGTHNTEDGHMHCNHVHATCRVCGRSFCITSQSVPVIAAPEGFEVENINYVITGVCAACKK